MKKVDVYTLGEFGVNRVRSPIHVNDGEMLSAQNATIRLVKGQLAISKRDGMDIINDAQVANGIILNISNIPLRTLGGRGVCTYSPDVPSASSWDDGTYSAELDLFVVVGFSVGGVMTSTDGENWTVQTPASTTTAWRGVTYSPTLGLFCAVGINSGNTNQQVMTSPDGVSWTARTASGDRDWECITWSEDLGLFVASAQTGLTSGMVMTSPDGINWTNRTCALGMFMIIWCSDLSLFVGVSTTTTTTSRILTSPDGITWTQRNMGTSTQLYGISYSPTLELLVAVGRINVPFTASAAYYSADGITWSQGVMPISMFGWVWDIEWSPELEIFMVMPRSGSFYGFSYDGINWVKVGLNCGGTSHSVLSYSSALEDFLILGTNPDGDVTVEMIGVN